MREKQQNYAIYITKVAYLEHAFTYIWLTNAQYYLTMLHFVAEAAKGEPVGFCQSLLRWDPCWAKAAVSWIETRGLRIGLNTALVLVSPYMWHTCTHKWKAKQNIGRRHSSNDF